MENKFRNRIAYTVIAIVVSALVGTIIINMGTTFHEYMFHNLIAHLLGCTSNSSVNIFSGVTTFDCPVMTPLMGIIIALSAPVGVFFVGMFLWNINKDSILRVVGGFMMFYSSIPSLFPMIPASDMSFAIRQGFNPIAGWLIYIILSGYFFWKFMEEVEDRQLFVRSR